MSVHNNLFNPKNLHKSQIKFHLFLIPLSIIMSLPLIFIINHAFKPFTELFAYPPRFFVRNPTFENFRLLLDFSSESGIPFTRYLFNSIVVTSAVVFLSIILSSITAFALSKLKFKNKKALFKINTMALMFVPIAVAIPRYLIIVNTGMFNTMWAHIFPLLAMPVGLFLVKQFVDQVPNEYIEAATIDGASHWMIFRKVIIPQIKPALVTVAFLAFQGSWGNMQSSNLYIDQETLRTLPFYLATLVDSSGNVVASAGLGAAAQLIQLVPNLIVFVFLQSKVMESMAHSGIK